MLDGNKTIGEVVRELRETRGFLLREIAAKLEVDPSLLSKIERGDKRPTKDQVLALSNILDVPERELLVVYLSDRVVYQLRDEEFANDALQLAEQKIEYLKKSNKIV